MRMFRLTALGIVWLAAAGAAAAQAAHLTSREVKNPVGKRATVCGRVVGIHFVSSGKGQPTFVHFATARSLAARRSSTKQELVRDREDHPLPGDFGSCGQKSESSPNTKIVGRLRSF